MSIRVLAGRSWPRRQHSQHMIAVLSCNGAHGLLVRERIHTSVRVLLRAAHLPDRAFSNYSLVADSQSLMLPCSMQSWLGATRHQPHHHLFRGNANRLPTT